MGSDIIVQRLRSVLGIQKEPVGIRTWQQVPARIPRYRGTAFPGFCTQIGEVLASGETFYTDREQCFCTGGVISTGVAPPLSEGERHEMLKAHFAISRSYRDEQTALHYEDAMEALCPQQPEPRAAVQIGLLRDMTDPELAIIFCTPAAADILNRAYCYISGEPVQGFGGNGACPFLIRMPLLSGKPFFSYSDVAWRKYVGLADEELTVTFPYQTLAAVVQVLPEVAQAYRRYGEPPE
ncbi:MAG: hypothetical protein FJ119_13675 [Deltaproteobacteria bacterium]|nr:hypothetical protein [Deltaproteobacteria bacterium]